MKKLSFKKYQEIRAWVYRTARPIDLFLWEYYFENGSKEAFLKVFSFYQNEDGGFAYGLEPDCWNPNSSPYMTNWWNASSLEDILTDAKHPIILGILKYLESGAYLSGDEWSWSIPSNNDYPHAPWLAYSSENNRSYNISVTGRLVAFILIYADENSKVFKKGLLIAESMIDKFNLFANDDFFACLGYRELIYAIERRGLEQQFNYTDIKESIAETSDEDTDNLKLDNLIDEMNEFDFLHIDFKNYFSDGDKYTGYCAVTQLWWQVDKAITNLKKLKDTDRIEMN